MKTIRTSHGPIASLDKSEIKKLHDALDVLEQSLNIETDNGTLHIRNCPEIASAHASLTLLLRGLKNDKTKEQWLLDECAS